MILCLGELIGSPALITAATPTDGNRMISETLLNQDAEEDQDTTHQVEKSSSEKETTSIEEKSIFSILFQLVAALGLVIGIMYVLLKFLHKRTRQFQPHQTMQNLGGVQLGQNKSVQVVKVGEQLLVVGVGDSIQLLKEIEDEEEKNKFFEPENRSFLTEEKKRTLTNIWPSAASKLMKQKETKTTSPFQEVFERQLEDMKETRKQARQKLKEYDS